MLTRTRKWGIMVALLVSASLAAAAKPDLNGGTWQVVAAPQALTTAAGKPPPLLPAAAAVYRQHVAARSRGDLSWDGTGRCLAPGLPRLLLMQPGAFEFLQRSDQIVITYQWNHMVRVVDMNVPHRDIAGPTYEGQSVGRWEKGTLVVDTIGFNDTTMLDSAGLPHSDALHVIERYTPAADGRTMRLRLKIEDPKTFSAPWDATLQLTHDPQGMIQEDVCLQRKGIHWDARKQGT